MQRLGQVSKQMLKPIWMIHKMGTLAGQWQLCWIPPRQLTS